MRLFRHQDENLGAWVLFAPEIDVPKILAWSPEGKSVSYYARAVVKAELLPPPQIENDVTVFVYLSDSCCKDITDFREDLPQWLEDVGLLDTKDQICRITFALRSHHPTLSCDSRTIVGVLKNSEATKIYDQFLYDLLEASTGTTRFLS